jgi:hypothetical protein
MQSARILPTQASGNGTDSAQVEKERLVLTSVMRVGLQEVARVPVKFPPNRDWVRTRGNREAMLERSLKVVSGERAVCRNRRSKERDVKCSVFVSRGKEVGRKTGMERMYVK